MNINSAVLSAIARVGKADVSTLTLETELVADLEYDSARALELVVELEGILDIEIEDEEAAKLNTVGDILEFVENV
jgi:acyl carrier protein